jgi:hypothetical protein
MNQAVELLTLSIKCPVPAREYDREQLTPKGEQVRGSTQELHTFTGDHLIFRMRSETVTYEWVGRKPPNLSGTTFTTKISFYYSSTPIVTVEDDEVSIECSSRYSQCIRDVRDGDSMTSGGTKFRVCDSKAAMAIKTALDILIKANARK